MNKAMRRNFILLALDAVFFFITWSLAGHDNVLPLFAAGLTDSAPLIGLVPAIALGLVVIPQVLLAGFVQRQPSKWRVVAWSMLGRLAMPLVALACFGPLARQPQTLLLFFLVLYALYSASDGVIIIALADLLPRLLPERERVRLFSLTQIITGLLGLLVGGIVSWTLANPRWPFPRNYGVLLALASVGLLISAVALLLLPRDSTPVQPYRASAAFAAAWRDQRFRRAVVGQLLTSSVWLAVPFYGVHATTRLGLPNTVAGLFVIVSSVAYILASLLLGVVGERRGIHWIIRCGAALVITSPLVALIAELAGHATPWSYALVFVGIGVFNSLRMLGYRNYIFALAPDGLRPSYVGLANGVVGLAAIMPVVGGWLLEGVSYSALFTLAAVGATAGFALSLALPRAAAPDAS